jgi:hypothetical protein
MNASIVRRGSLLGAVIISLMVMNIATLAQTRTRPKVVTNTSTSYRYAYQHGYRGGYEDGFTKGKSDFNENQSRDFSSSEAYRDADRGYTNGMGTRVEFQEGYRIGFEMGYNDGYYGRPYSISMPTNLGRAVVAAVNASGAGDVADDSSRTRRSDERPPVAAPSRDETRADTSVSRGSIRIPDGVQMKIRLTTQISTKTNKEGDRFTAIVLDPTEYADATIEGHIAKLNKSGKATGKTELSLAFDTIRLRDGRSGRLAAQVERVYESEKVKTVDEEGNVETGSRTKDTAVRGAGGAALGAIIGGIAGGGKGAAIGAAIGGGVGVGSVFVEGGKDMVLEPGTEVLIRTAAPARERN